MCEDSSRRNATSARLEAHAFSTIPMIYSRTIRKHRKTLFLSKNYKGKSFRCTFIKADGTVCGRLEKHAVQLLNHITSTHKKPIFTVNFLLRLLCINWKKELVDCRQYKCQYCDFTCNTSSYSRFQRHIIFELGLSNADNQKRDTKLKGNAERINQILAEYTVQKTMETLAKKRKVFKKAADKQPTENTTKKSAPKKGRKSK